MKRKKLRQLVKESIDNIDATRDGGMDYTSDHTRNSESGIPSMEDIKFEIDLLFEMVESLLYYQEGGDINYEQLSNILLSLHRKSKIDNVEEFFIDWVSSQKNNKLPNISSGSFLNGILSFDGLWSAYEGQLDADQQDKFNELWGEAYGYFKSKYRKEI